jgi:hypothetical protein
MAAVFLDIEKALDTAWHSGNLSELECSTSLIKLIASFLTSRKFKVWIKGEFSTHRNNGRGASRLCPCSSIEQSLYINDAPAAPGTHFALFTDDTCIYATEKHERRVLSKLQRGLTAVKSWRESWNRKIDEGKTQAIYFSRSLRVPEDELQLNGWDIPFVNNVESLGAIFDRRMAWKLHIERTSVKALATYIRTYSLFKSERLSINIAT